MICLVISLVQVKCPPFITNLITPSPSIHDEPFRDIQNGAANEKKSASFDPTRLLYKTRVIRVCRLLRLPALRTLRLRFELAIKGAAELELGPHPDPSLSGRGEVKHDIFC